MARTQILDASATAKENRLLAALPKAAYRRLLPDLEPTTLQVGDALFHPAGKLQYAYFPTSAIVTLSYGLEEGGVMAKAWPVGREGLVGISLFLGSPKRDNRADVQIAGLAFRLPAAALLTEFKRADTFQHLLLRYVFALVTQASQLGLCNHYHPIERRVCRFLSRVFDRVSGNEVALTQERIAELLGVRRATIQQAALQLQSAGIIEYQRGHIKLISRKKLEARSCVCDAIIRRAFQAVFEQANWPVGNATGAKQC
ncbi:MAG TPA: Crp/Fnr family transcriptional regulator [Steroidobacteraceae bacterium]|nr:Crp/Fnr family transcriptional regulator [Steroidobacteraceae bacterium]